MKKILAFVFAVSLFFITGKDSFSQDMPARNNVKNNTTVNETNHSTMQLEAKKNLFENTDAISRLQSVNTTESQLDGMGPNRTQALVPVIIGNGSSSSNARAPQGSRLFSRHKVLVTGTEMVASGFSGAVTSIGWTWNVVDAAGAPLSQTVATTGNIRVYMKDTIGTATTVGGTFIDTNGVGYTLVVNSTLTIPTGTTQINIDLPAGGAGTSTYTPVTGNGVLYIVVYKTTTAVSGTVAGVFPPTVFCTNLGGTCLTYQSTTVTGSIGASSAFRPETRFGGNQLIDIVTAGPIYTLGEKKVNCIDTNVVEFVFTHKRIGIDTLDFKIYQKSVPSNVIVDSIGFFVVVNDATTPVVYSIDVDFLKTLNVLQADSLICTITPRGTEQVTGNNRSSTFTKVGLSSYNQAITGATTSGGVGYNSNPNGTSELATGYESLCGTKLTSMDYILTAAATSQQYRVRVYAGDSVDKPGTLLFDSPVLATPVGTGFVNTRYRFDNPIVLPPGRFYISVVQMALLTNIGLGYQQEDPVRFGAFYSFVSANGGWSDVGGSTFKLNMRANTESLSLTALIQGLYDDGSNTSLSDTITVNIRSTAGAIISSDKAKNNANGVSSFSFSNLAIGVPYYIDVVHRNSLEVASSVTVSYSATGVISYNFTGSQSSGYGTNPLVLKGTKWCLYSGDVTQDQTIDAADLAEVENAKDQSLSGYVVTDLNGDDFVDASDLAICENSKDAGPVGEYPY